MAMNHPRLIRMAAHVGMIGPILFAVALTGLTIAQADFMRSLGWDPLHAIIDWPSGLALGPYGWLMTAAFFVSGLAMMFFAYGLRLALNERLAPTLMMLAGLGMMGLVFPTDPTLSTITRTWHGLLHDSFFVLIGVTPMPSIVLLGFVFRQNERWKDLSHYTWITVALAIPTFWLKGAAFYAFLFAVLVWNEIIAIRLRSVEAN